MGFEFTSHRNETDQKLRQALGMMLEEWGDVAQGFASKDAPVDTGNLAGSIDTRKNIDAIEMIVGTNVKYAPSVEFNDKAHHEVGKAHYLRDSVAKHVDVYQAIAKKYLGSL